MFHTFTYIKFPEQKKSMATVFDQWPRVVRGKAVKQGSEGVTASGSGFFGVNDEKCFKMRL